MGDAYAVVSCHVERPLDDRCWRLFCELQERRPGGFAIAALMRPPDSEDEARWLERARHASERGPLGHHTHFGGPTQARPRGGDAAARVRDEAEWLRANGLSPRLFCGGGWYMDERVAETLASLSYADCTGTAFRPRYLAPEAQRLQVDRPAWLTLPTGRLLELPTTHSIGMAARAALSRSLPDAVHVYFHDTDLVSPPRRGALVAALAVIGRRRPVTDLAALADRVAPPELAFSEASRP